MQARGLALVMVVFVSRPFGAQEHATGTFARTPSCAPPAMGSRRALKLPARDLSGQHRVEFVLDDSVGGSRRSATGQLTLRATAPNRARAPNPKVLIPYYGFTDVDFEKLGRVELAHPVWRSDPDSPGAQVIYNSQDSTLSMVLGNSITNRGVATDVGLYLRVYQLTDSGMTGRWRAASRLPDALSGYFCVSFGSPDR